VEHCGVNVERIMLPIILEVGRRPQLSEQLFEFAKWGNP